MQPREPGQVLGGKYRLVSLLGSGGMGSVWHAEHLMLSSPVALKLIEPATAREPDAVSRFLREARTAAALRSPHVVQILDYGVEGDTPYIAMELLDGESLAQRLATRGRLGTRETARIIQHIARAIARAHDAGIVHRDLKPENVFIVRNDDEELIKVLDFGIVKAIPSTLGDSTAATPTRTGTVLGTPYFMSPEQAEGVKTVDHRTDIWALGVIAYRCLLGKLPFSGEVVGKLILEICTRPLPVPSRTGPVPDGFDAWFAKACARELDVRFSSAKQAAAEFSRLSDVELLLGPSEPPPASEPASEVAAEPVSEPPLGATTGHSTNSELASRARASRSRRVGVLLLVAVVSVGTALALRNRGTPIASTAPNAASGAPLQEPAPAPHVAAPVLRALESSPGSGSEAPREPAIAAPATAHEASPLAAGADAAPRPPPADVRKPSAPHKPPPANKPSAPTPAKPVVDLGI